jgi:heme/copper-type cytochrome/quinol oxidase subunit 3
MIPYTVERRADTGVTNVTLGIWLFLASEVMLFGALFSSYALLRVSAVQWPHGRELLNLPLGATNTIVLVIMGVLTWASRRNDTNDGSDTNDTTYRNDGNDRNGATYRIPGFPGVARSGRLLGIASLLAVVFLVVKGIEWRGEIAAGLIPSVNTFLAMYFTLTGIHALHVVGGLVANVWAIAGARRVGDAMTLGRLRALALYWTFVDVVWLVIFVLLYLS